MMTRLLTILCKRINNGLFFYFVVIKCKITYSFLHFCRLIECRALTKQEVF